MGILRVLVFLLYADFWEARRERLPQRKPNGAVVVYTMTYYSKVMNPAPIVPLRMAAKAITVRRHRDNSFKVFVLFPEFASLKDGFAT